MGPNFTLNYGARYDLHVPVRRAEQQLLDRRSRRRLRRLRRRQPLQARHAHRAAADVPPARGGRARLSDGLEQHLAERRLGVDAERQGRVAAAADRRRPATSSVRAATAGRITRLGLTDFTGQVGEQSGRLAERVPARWRSAISARCRCCCATPAGSARRRSRRRPVYPFTRRRRPATSRSSAPTCGCRTPIPGRPASRARSASNDVDRSALSRRAVRATTGAPTTTTS